MSGILTAALALAGGRAVQLIGESVNPSALSPSTATGTVNLNNTGSYTDTQGHSYNWLLSGSAASYEAMAILQGSTTLTASGSALGSWLALSSTRSWSYTRSGVGEDTAHLLIQIRPTGGSPIASCTVNFDCLVS